MHWTLDVVAMWNKLLQWFNNDTTSVYLVGIKRLSSLTINEWNDLCFMSFHPQCCYNSMEQDATTKRIKI